MTSLRTLAIGATPWLSSVLLIGCTGPRMAPPADLASASEVLAVSDRTRWSGQFVNEGFKLGNYDVVDVDRAWSSTSGSGFGPWSKETKTTGFSYALAAGGKKLPGKCSSVSSSQAVGGFSWGHMKIACACDGEEGTSELVMTDKGRTLKVRDTEYKLEPVHALAGGGTLADPTGFRADGDQPLGAVEVMHPGQIWLKKGLDDATRATTACIFVGLMLYKAPSATP